MERSKTKKRFTTKKVWTKKKNGLYGWGVRRQKILSTSKENKESILETSEASELGEVSKNSFAIDFSKRKSTCHTCNRTIEKGELRLMNSKKFHHPYCVIQNSSKVGIHSELFQDPSDGWSEISSEENKSIPYKNNEDSKEGFLDSQDVGAEQKFKLGENLKEEPIVSCKFTVQEVEENFFSEENSKHVSYCINRIFSFKKQIRSNLNKIENIDSIEALKHKSRYIYNLKTKVDKNQESSMKASFESLRKHALDHNVTAIHLPLICFGLNGLTWPCVRSIIEEVFHGENIGFIAYCIKQDEKFKATQGPNIRENKNRNKQKHTNENVKGESKPNLESVYDNDNKV